ncbi:exo-alpha-sialidase [Archangium violaceum]|uniref:sialidase family protein n=1 Tax=Archangium violaceum TaxID=83451 RepID=UPI0019526B58|nr:sialidase family protein [Archangium violaceum]QRN99720.1 exo-alpha-sialidase [Archangium violaceum]
MLLSPQAGLARDGFGAAGNMSEHRAHSREPAVEISGEHVFAAWIDMRTGYGDVYFRKSADRGLTYGQAQNLSNSHARASEVHVTKAQANVYVVWVEDGIRLRTSHDFGVTFGPIQVLSESGRSPRIVAAGGNVYVAWSRSEKEGELLFRASHDFGDSFDAALVLSEQSSGGDLDLGAQGANVHAVWDDGSHVYFRRSTDEGRSFVPVQVLDEGAEASEDSRLVTDARGVYVVWREGSGCGSEIVFRRSITGGASFEPILNLSRSPVASLDPLIDVHDEAVFILWKEERAGQSDIFLARSSDGGVTFGVPWNVSETPGKSSQYAISSSGDFIRIVWREKTGSGGEIFYRSSANRGASFGEVLNLSQSPGKSTSPVIIASGRGAEVQILWEEDFPGNREIFHRRGVPEP